MARSATRRVNSPGSSPENLHTGLTTELKESGEWHRLRRELSDPNNLPPDIDRGSAEYPDDLDDDVPF